MKSGIVAGILVLIIIAAVAFTIMNAGPGGGDVPDEVYNRLRPVYNTEAKEVVEVKTGDWEQKFEVIPESGYRKNDGTVYAPVHKCAACGEMTAAAPVPADVTPEKAEEIRQAYTCPICGEKAYQMEAPPMP